MSEVEPGTGSSPTEDPEVSAWLKEIGFGIYADAFAASGITRNRLGGLTEEDLKKLGVSKIVDRANLLTQISLITRDPGDSGPQRSATADKIPGGISISKIPGFPGVPQFAGLGTPVGGGGVSPKPKPAALSSIEPPQAMVIQPGAVIHPVRAGGEAFAEPVQKKQGWKRFGGKFLVISILVHLLFGIGAAYYVVQTITAKRKLTFKGGPPTVNPGQHAVEHKVQMAKKKNSMSAPAPSKRITSTGVSKVALPPMPSAPSTNATASSNMPGMTGIGPGVGPSMGRPGNGGAGGAVPIFGLKTGNGLQGSFYDLKQTRDKRPTPIKDVETFVRELDKFLKGGWGQNFFDKYFKAPAPLYATQIFVPKINSEDAPAAFNVQNDVQPSLWKAIYKGEVSPPESGLYHFVGGADNILIVRFQGSVVLDRSWDYQKRYGIDKFWKPVANYDYGFGGVPDGFAKGTTIDLRRGDFYKIEILLGDDGGITNFSLLFEQEGVKYEKTSNGLPILPIFRVAADPPPAGEHPPYMENGPIWKIRGPAGSLFSH